MNAEHVPPAQDLLFDGNFSPLPDDLGFRGPIACRAADITYRQLDYWARTGLVVPEIRTAGGRGEFVAGDVPARWVAATDPRLRRWWTTCGIRYARRT